MRVLLARSTAQEITIVNLRVQSCVYVWASKVLNERRLSSRFQSRAPYCLDSALRKVYDKKFLSNTRMVRDSSI